MEALIFFVELFIVLVLIFIGARLGGVGLGVMGGIGMLILVFFFHAKPGELPIDVMMIILAVVTAAGALQTSGGLDLMVKAADSLIRKNPAKITVISPIVCYFFTFCAGTGHVAYAVLPAIAEVSKEAGVRPERPMSVSVIASQQAITASPISAATAALLGIVAVQGVSLIQILAVCVPATFIGCILAAISVYKKGKELDEDPEYTKRVLEGFVEEQEKITEADKAAMEKANKSPKPKGRHRQSAIICIIIFFIAFISILILGAFESLRPVFDSKPLSMTITIEIIMLTAAAVMVLFIMVLEGKEKTKEISNSNVLQSGCIAVISIFGVAWMGNTLFVANQDFIVGSCEEIIQSAPWLFAILLFVCSILLFSQAATVKLLMPVGLALGIPPALLVGMFPMVNGYFFIPNYPTVVAAINFDTTGTTKVGRYVLNHSFMLPGMVATISGTLIACGLSAVIIGF